MRFTMNRRLMLGIAVIACISVVALYTLLFSDMTIWGRKHIYTHLKSLAAEAKRNPSDQRSIHELIAAMQSGSSFQRTTAADVLGSLGPQASPAADSLIEAANGADGYLSAAAVRALRDIGPDAGKAIPTLERIVKERPHDSTWDAAVDALGTAGDLDDEDIIQMLKAIERDRDEGSRYLARRALATLEYRKANPTTTRVPYILPSSDARTNVAGSEGRRELK